MMITIAGLSVLRIHLETTSAPLPSLRSPQKMRVTICWAVTMGRTSAARRTARRRRDNTGKPMGLIGGAYRTSDASRARLLRRQERAMSALPVAETTARNAPTARNIAGSTAGVLGEPGSSA